MEVRAGFPVHRHRVGTGLGEGAQVALGLADHEVDLEGEVGLAAKRPQGVGPEGEVGHEVAVHDVDVEPVGAAPLQPVDRLRQPAEVSGEQRGGDDQAVDAARPRAGHGRRVRDAGWVAVPARRTGEGRSVLPMAGVQDRTIALMIERARRGGDVLGGG